MKKLFVIFFIVFETIVSAQTVSLTGRVQNLEDGTVLKKAEINLCHGVIYTDTSGNFSAFIGKGESCALRIKLDGYKFHTQTLHLLRDTSLVFYLEPVGVNLEEVTVQAEKDNSFGISRLNNIEGTTIFAGKKSEAVYVQDLNANLATNNSRQVFSKIPGINIFENDGSGATIGIGGRGLNPNRISNFNTRQNGYDISADALGYPESYYTPPTEAIERIEILRGAAAMQFGTQFGGMINYKFVEAPLDKKIEGKFRQTGGSFGLFNSFNQVYGMVGKISYNTFYQYKHYTGWRDRSELNSHTAFAALTYRINDKLSVKGEYTFLNYLAQQPGGMTDKQFALDESAVNRYRNWFKVNWNLASISADYQLSEKTRINFRSFALKAGRDALGVLGRADRADDPNVNRNLLSDDYNNFGAELRLLQRYRLMGFNSHFLVGGRYYRGKTLREQGDADKTDKANFEFLHPDNLENSAYTFPSFNSSIFFENIFQMNSRWSITPGIRLEEINTASDGYYRILNKNLKLDTLLDEKVQDNRSNKRSFILMGIGTQFKVSKALEFYANFSQNYRSINFNDMRVANPNFQVDPNLSDEKGYTADAGIRGAKKNLLYFDASVFVLQYNNRIGTTLQLDTNLFQLIRYRTNIGASRNVGLETFAELDWAKLYNKESRHKISTFVNFAWTDAIYQSPNKAYNNKKVEYVPKIILRTGLTYGIKKFSVTCQYSYVSEQFSDATNAKTSSSGLYGIIPSYSVVDLSANYSWKIWALSAGVNNALNAKYFTRRAEGYPGPGILPADPINFYFTLQIKLP